MSIMPWGLLWYDDKDDGLENKIARAAQRYMEKFGNSPNTCVIHPELLQGEGVDVPGYKVITHPTVLKNHLWIGENGEL